MYRPVTTGEPMSTKTAPKRMITNADRTLRRRRRRQCCNELGRYGIRDGNSPGQPSNELACNKEARVVRHGPRNWSVGTPGSSGKPLCHVSQAGAGAIPISNLLQAAARLPSAWLTRRAMPILVSQLLFAHDILTNHHSIQSALPTRPRPSAPLAVLAQHSVYQQPRA